MFNDLRIVDSDGHVFLEPPDLFERYPRQELNSPRVEQSGHGLSIDGHETASIPQALPGDVAVYTGFDPGAVLGSLAAEGFTAEGVVNVGSMWRGSTFLSSMDHFTLVGSKGWTQSSPVRLLGRTVDGWLSTRQTRGGRIVGAAPIPLHSVEGALAELSYAHEQLGINAVWTRPNPVGGRPLGAAEFDPFFEALADQKIPLSLHEGSGSMMQNIGSERFTETWFEQHACVHPMEQQMAMLSLIVQGVFERHPTLRVAFLESGAAWLPSWLHRLDEHAGAGALGEKLRI